MIRVLIVDDSPLVRKITTDILGSDPMIRVIGTAPNGEVAIKKVSLLDPDVVTMDLEMPGIGGLRAIEKIMNIKPTPIIVLSSYIGKSAELALKALDLGAVDFIAKPEVSLSGGIDTIASELKNKIKDVSGMKVKAIKDIKDTDMNISINREANSIKGKNRFLSQNLSEYKNRKYEIVAIGASTGGPKALKEILTSIPSDFPVGIVIVQHMPPVFTKIFADRLNSICKITVKEASDGDLIIPGRALIAPGDFHLTVTKNDRVPRILLHKWSPVSGHRPSVDILMNSVAKEFSEKAVGIIMTGMGKDGAEGIAELKRNGGYIIAQNEETSVIYGMNKQVVLNGDADEVLPIEMIGSRIKELVFENTPIVS